MKLALLLLLLPAATALADTIKPPVNLPPHDPATMVVHGSHQRTRTPQGPAVSALVARLGHPPVRVFVRESECGLPAPTAWMLRGDQIIELSSAIAEPTMLAICRGK